ncbi:MAG: glycerol-3-phosphate 1-O-acyltransferase PlsY [Dehalococcoidales bacterium]|nr:glycerol-3-phosphate 1-O-acyltransferase PlsY [Dehalococcoidales bacterium]
MTPLLYLAVVIIGYLLGSIPFGLLIARIFAKKDVRQVGSGKIGMTNVMRAAGKKAAAASLILDMGKGIAAVLLAGLIFSGYVNGSTVGFTWYESAKVLAALAAIAGHTWSVFLKFKGGRGVATFIGGLLALHWPAAVVGGGLMLIIGFRTKYMSMGSIIGAVTAFIMLTMLNLLRIDFLKPYPPIEYVTYAMICAVFIYVMHRDNIIRLVSGTERKIGEKANVETSVPSNNPK